MITHADSSKNRMCNFVANISERQDQRTGVTLVEILVVFALIGLLIAMIAPAIVWSREMARSGQCKSHLRQLGIAQASYHSDHGVYAVKLTPMRRLLPYVGQSALYHQIESFPPGVPLPSLTFGVAIYVCPADSMANASVGRVSYLLCEGNGEAWHNGVILPVTILQAPPYLDDPFTKASEIVDGLSNTSFYSERLWEDLNESVNGRLAEPRRHIWHTAVQSSSVNGFANECVNRRTADPLPRGINITDTLLQSEGYNHIVEPNSPGCFNGPVGVTSGPFFSTAKTATSLHRGGCNVLFMDGSVHFISEHVARAVWRAVGSRNGAEVVSDLP